MANKLAKLEVLKEAAKASTTGIDATLTTLLEVAAAMTERIAGVPVGALRRQVGIIEYPEATPFGVALRLAHRPLETITQVKSIHGPADSDDFSAATELVEGTDYIVESSELGMLRRLRDTWRTGPRANLVVYTAGFADPDDAVGGDAIEPPTDLQWANVVQAVQLFNLRQTAGIKGVDAGGAQGQLGHAKPHPLLVEAATRYRRHSLS